MLLSNRIKLEESPYQIIPDATILDLLYSEKVKHFEDFLSQSGKQDIMRILEKDAHYWVNLLNNTHLSPRVLLLGYPSAELNTELSTNETERTEQQIDSLGPENLEKAALKLEEAIERQVFPPNDVLASVPVANVTSITYRKLTWYNYTAIGGWEFGGAFKESIDDRITSLKDIKDGNGPFLFSETFLMFIYVDQAARA